MRPRRLLVLFALSAAIPKSAHAYLDPGTGSLLLQLSIAGILGFLFAFKLYWYKFKSAILRIFDRKTGGETVSDSGGSDSINESKN